MTTTSPPPTSASAAELQPYVLRPFAHARAERRDEGNADQQQAGHMVAVGEEAGRDAEIALPVEIPGRSCGIGAGDLEDSEQYPRDRAGDQRGGEPSRRIAAQADHCRQHPERREQRQQGRDSVVGREGHRQRSRIDAEQLEALQKLFPSGQRTPD